jgi:RHS repeat-associated protein
VATPARADGPRYVGFIASATDQLLGAGGFGYDVHGDPASSSGSGGDGALIGTSFGPYGENVAPRDTAMGMGMQGELTLAGGMVDLRARQYDPETGSFLSPDPLDGVAGTTTLTNRYAYANNDPVNQSDPLGLRGDTKCIGDQSPFSNNGKGICYPQKKPSLLHQIVTGVAGLVVGVGCTLATGGSMVLGCAALGGAIAKGGQSLWDCGSLSADCVRQAGIDAAKGGFAAMVAVGAAELGGGFIGAGTFLSGAIGGSAFSITDSLLNGRAPTLSSVLEGAAIGGVLATVLEPVMGAVAEVADGLGEGAAIGGEGETTGGVPEIDPYGMGDEGAGPYRPNGVASNSPSDAAPSDLADGVAESSEDVVGSRSRWTRTEVNGTRVYQRDDLIDPELTDARGRTNVERMQSGLAPVGPDGESINLHHMLQTADGPIAEVSQTFHQENSSVIHINPNTTPSGIDRAEFGAWRREYWKLRACDFGSC